MTPARLRLLAELLGEYRVEHAPTWVRPYCTTLRRMVRDTAKAETVDVDPDVILDAYDEAGR